MVAGGGAIGFGVALLVSVAAGVFCDVSVAQLGEDAADGGQGGFEFGFEAVEVAGGLREVDLRDAVCYVGNSFVTFK